MFPMTMSPEMQQKLMAFMSGLRPGGAQTALPTSMPQGNGMQPPQMPQQSQMPRLGGNNTQLPSGTAIPAFRGMPMSAQPTYQPKSVSGHGIGMLPAAVMAFKQASHQKSVQKARGLVDEWLAQQDNPDTQKNLEKLAQQDPKIAKVLEEKKKQLAKVHDEAMKDPNSAAAQGIQLAYQDQQAKEQQKQAAQEQQMKMQQMQAQMQAEQARAQYWKQYGEAAERKGEVTPEDIYKQQQQNERTKMTIQGGLDRTVLSITNMNTRTNAKIASLEKIAALHEKGSSERAKMRGQQSQAATAMIRQYKNIQSEITNLDREQKDMQDNMAKSPITSWWSGASAEYEARSQAIEAKRTMLEGRLQQLDESVSQMQQGGVLPQDSDIPTPVTSGATDHPAGPKIHDFTNRK